LSDSHSTGAGNRLTSPNRGFHALDHQVADVATIDAAGGRHPGDRLAVAAIQGKGDAYPLAVVAADLKAVRAPTGVGAIDGDPAIMPALGTLVSMALEQQPMCLHHPVDPLGIDCRPTLFLVSAPDQGVNPPIAVSRLAGDDPLISASSSASGCGRRPRPWRGAAIA
jgi:hypothetical protein